MKTNNIDAIKNGVQIVLLGKPEDIAFVYQDLGYFGEVEYHPSADLHHSVYGDIINSIPCDKPFASQSYEFVEALAGSARELQFVTCRKMNDGEIAVRSLTKHEVAVYISSVGFDPRD